MRILGITIPEEKRLEIGLTTLYGVGRPLAHKILTKAKIDWGKKPKDLSVADENEIRKIIEGYKIDGKMGPNLNIGRMKLNTNNHREDFDFQRQSNNNSLAPHYKETNYNFNEKMGKSFARFNNLNFALLRILLLAYR